jgi:hypothetical protein
VFSLEVHLDGDTITPSRHHAITPSRHHAITPSRHHAITPSRHHTASAAVAGGTKRETDGPAQQVASYPNVTFPVRPPYQEVAMNRRTLTGLAFLALVLHFTIAGGWTNPNALVASGGDPLDDCEGVSETFNCESNPGKTCTMTHIKLGEGTPKTRYAPNGTIAGCGDNKFVDCKGQDYSPAETGCKEKGAGGS